MNKVKLIFAIILISNTILAQPQWKFPIAFEDGSGAKDTIWYIWDSTATAGIDTLLGEGKVLMDPNAFNVFVTDFNPDSTKTHALPFNGSTPNNHIRAINYQYPITISWDSILFSNFFTVGDSLIANAYIQNDYFFLVNNGGPIPGTFNMIETNAVAAPAFNWGSMNQFPMQILITRFSTTDIFEDQSKGLIVSPNPFSRLLEFEFKKSIEWAKIVNTDGRVVFEHSFNTNSDSEIFDLEALQNGIYILIYKSPEQLYTEKIIKL
ncbi:MAG: T9SS type A sorting domain-containing protein [Bacteroidota bacterium]